MKQFNQPLQLKIGIVSEAKELDPEIIFEEPLVAHRLADVLDNEVLDRALLTNLLPYGEDLAVNIIESMKTQARKDFLYQLKDSIEGGSQPISYETLNSLGVYMNGEGTALDCIMSKMEQKMFTQRGLEKLKRDYRVNFNVFTRYLLSRMHLYIVGNDFIAYDFKSGRFLNVLDDFIKAQAKAILHEAVDDIWQVPYGKNVLEQLRLDAERLECVEEDNRYLNLNNGILRLHDMQLFKHTPKIISLTQLPVSYDLGAKCPCFLQYLDTVFNGDKDLIALVQEVFGYCLTTETKLQQFFIFYGNGSNGKSVLANIMRKVLGEDNCSSATLEQLSKQFGGQVIQNKRLNISGESDSSKNVLNTQQLKLITGEDMVQVESKFKNPIMIRPYVKLIVLSNHYPKTEDTSDGFLRRCVFIPFNVRFVEKGMKLKAKEAHKDKDLMTKLEEELNGIFMWALEGYKRLKANNYKLTESSASDQVLKDFMIYNNPIKEFITECLVISVGNREKKTDIHKAYQAWCKKNNVRSGLNISAKEFWREFGRSVIVVNNYDYKIQKSDGIRYVCNLKIK